MSSSPNPKHTVFGPAPGYPQTVRYRLPAGLAEEVLREAQRRRISPSTVVAVILAQGLSGFSAAGVVERLEHAVRASVQLGPCLSCGTLPASAVGASDV